MKYLFVKFWRDIKKLWSQFFSVFIMAMISMTIFAGMGCVWNGMQISSDKYFEDTNLADAWVTCNGVTDDDMSQVKEISYISDTEPSMTFPAECNHNGKDTDIRFTTFDNESISVMKPLIRSGKDMYEEDSDENDGIWLDEDYAKANDIEVGDTIEITLGKKKCDVTVKGIVLHSENIYFVSSSTDNLPDHELYGYGYMKEDYAESLMGAISFNQIRINFKNEDISETSGSNNDISKEMLQEDLDDIFGDRLQKVALRDDCISITRIEDEQAQIKKMSMLFSVVFVLLSLLAMYTTMNRLVNNQVVQIGTMKALGYFNSHIYMHYACYGILVSLFGGGLGIVLGRLFISDIVMNIKKSLLTLPEWEKVFPVESFILWAGIIIICTLSALLTVRKVIKGVPAQTIRGNIEQKNTHQKPLKRSKISYDWLWTLRSIKVHPIRCIMGIIAVAGSLILMVAGVGVWDSLNSSYDSVFEDEYTYEYAASIKSGQQSEIKKNLTDKNVQYSQTISATFFKDNKNAEKQNDISGVVTVLSDGNLIHLFSSENKDEITPSGDEAIITRKLANQLGIKKGDIVYYKIDQDTDRKEVKIAEISEAKMPQGIFVSEEMWDDFAADTVYLGDEESYDAVKDSDSVSGLISIESQQDNMDTMLESVHVVVYILIIAAFVLSSVILYNLGTLNYIERYREYATMKVLGFYKKEINKMVLKDCLINLIGGLLIGIPGSIAFLRLYISVISMDNMEWVPYINPLHFVIVAIVIIVFSLLINSIVCLKIKKVNMVEALKSMD